jgi:nucleoside-diphosphate-sugar epimerase
MKIFLAGAAGAIGRRLVPLLLGAGHHVVGTTRSTSKADLLRAAGVEPVVLDIFDSALLTHAVSATRPDIVIPQLTAGRVVRLRNGCRSATINPFAMNT